MPSQHISMRLYQRPLLGLATTLLTLNAPTTTNAQQLEDTESVSFPTEPDELDVSLPLFDSDLEGIAHDSAFKMPDSEITMPEPESDDNFTPAVTFNHYFIVLAILGVLCSVLFLLYARRRRRRAHLLLRTSSQNPLARRLSGFTPWGRGNRHAPQPELGAYSHKGMEERSEAPPAYDCGDKPPPFRVGVSEIAPSRSTSPSPERTCSEEMELWNLQMRGDANALTLPDYKDSAEKAGDGIARPQGAVSPSLRPVSIRSVLSHAENAALERGV